jgi:hypothetical protein
MHADFSARISRISMGRLCARDQLWPAVDFQRAIVVCALEPAQQIAQVKAAVQNKGLLWFGVTVTNGSPEDGPMDRVLSM